MDWSNIIVSLVTAVLSGGVTLAVCLINNNALNNKAKIENEKILGLIQYRLDEQSNIIDELRKEVKENNQVKDRILKAEGQLELIETKYNELSRRLDRLEVK